jgi:light-regulated signal transduction histidine kinase (bacteriophytochrome)
MSRMGGGGWGESQYYDAAMYIGARGKLSDMMRSARQSDWEDADVEKLLKSYIADEEKEQVFELFHTGKSAHADSSRSMGVGLNVCRMIMQAHGSTISVHDNVPHGSVFVFTLKAEDIKYE